MVGVTASSGNGVPEVSWGDSFFFYDPYQTADRRHRFATIVTRDSLLASIPRPDLTGPASSGATCHRPRDLPAAGRLSGPAGFAVHAAELGFLTELGLCPSALVRTSEYCAGAMGGARRTSAS